MSENLIIFDTTLRDGEQSPGACNKILEPSARAHPQTGGV
jgi:hypothetical protein